MVIAKLDRMHEKYNNIIMLSHTHGQAAVPTTFGKEMKVFHYTSILLAVRFKCPPCTEDTIHVMAFFVMSR